MKIYFHTKDLGHWTFPSFSLIILCLLLMKNVNAQQAIPLYGGAIPGAKVIPVDYVEQTMYGYDSIAKVAYVSTPELFIYQPKEPTGAAVIICPGGGYGLLAIDKEGHEVAKHFQEMGISAFVLKYRLPSDLIMEDKTTGPLQDALRAMYLVRKNAATWHIDANKIGIMGFSAGGHLAAMASTLYNEVKLENPENISLRPNFSILIYPVISFGQYTHAGSVKRLLGEQPTELQKQYFSADLNVDTQTPPTFLVHANDDKSVPMQNSVRYNDALIKNKVSAELHIYQEGGHGFGLHNKTTKDDWFERLKNWMEANRFN